MKFYQNILIFQFQTFVIIVFINIFFPHTHLFNNDVYYVDEIDQNEDRREKETSWIFDPAWRFVLCTNKHSFNPGSIYFIWGAFIYYVSTFFFIKPNIFTNFFEQLFSSLSTNREKFVKT